MLEVLKLTQASWMWLQRLAYWIALPYPRGNNRESGLRNTLRHKARREGLHSGLGHRFWTLLMYQEAGSGWS